MIQKMTRRPRGFRIAQVVCERGVRNLHTACRPPAEAVLGAAEKQFETAKDIVSQLLLYNVSARALSYAPLRFDRPRADGLCCLNAPLRFDRPHADGLSPLALAGQITLTLLRRGWHVRTAAVEGAG